MTSKQNHSQKVKPANEEWIDRSIRETKAEQEKSEKLIHDEGTQNAKIKLTEWAVTDVIQWLEVKQLHQFIFLFQKHHVTGCDLANLTLPFLDNYDHISLDEREVLLSEIYLLLNPGKVYASEEDLTKIRSPVDKKKYYAAIELAQDKSASLPRSSSVLVLTNQSSPRSISVSSGQSSPRIKPRHKSESGTDPRIKVSKFDRLLSDTKKRKTMPKITQSTQVKPVFEYMQQYGPHCVQCLELSPQQYCDVTMVTDSEGHVMINKVPEFLGHKLHYGDRVLEINGQIAQLHQRGVDTHLAAMLNHKSPASLVILTEHKTSNNSNDGLVDDKWNKLHSMLVQMRDSDTVPRIDIPVLPSDQEQYLKHTTMLQEEINKLEDRVREQHRLSDKLQVKLDDREAIMHDLEVSRDKAIEKLTQSRNKIKSKGGQLIGGTEYYNMTMDSLNVETATKEEVVESLRDIVKEASKQKWYLDRLISLIIEDSPWLLDEIDSQFDSLTLTDQSEVFC